MYNCWPHSQAEFMILTNNREEGRLQYFAFAFNLSAMENALYNKKTVPRVLRIN